MKHTFKRAMSLFMALAMVLTMVPSFGTHVHAEELETEPVVMTEEPATEAPVVEAPETEAAETEAPTQAPETEAPATEAPVVETEAPEVTEEAPEVVETEPAEETEAIEESFPEEILEEEIIEEEAVAEITADLSGFAVTGLTPSWKCESNEKNGSVVAVGNTITIKAKGGNLRKTKIELTLTNNLGSDAKLKFICTYGSGTVTFDSGTSVSDGSFEKVLANGGAVTVTFEAARNSVSTLKITEISLISTTAADANLTFKAPANGTYTVDGTSVAGDTEMTVAAGTAVTLVATPDSGYQFFGWQKADGTYLSQDAVYTLTAAQDEIITPVFIDATIALFGVGEAKYMDLTEAGAAATAGTFKTIVLLNNGTVSGNHTIPAGTTLLIPYDDANTAYGATASCTSWSSRTDASGHIAWESPSAYRTLTLADDAKITVNGNIEVSGRHAAAAASSPNNGRYGGSPTGKLGYINMESGSHIALNSGANLYAWGYVYGDGTITAKSGASIYENFQVMDFRGGTATSALATEFLVFPLSQYYVQNVEVATRYEYGASEYIATSIFMSNQCFSATVKFIGDGAMFQPAAGSYFTKDYNPATDRLEMHAYGNSTMASMSLELGGTGIDSSDFILPITNNIEIHLHTGTTTLKQNMMLLPGSSLSVDQGAILDLAYTDATGEIVTAGGHMLQVFDSENWGRGLNVETLEDTTGLSFVHPSKQFAPLEYTCTKRYSRTIADLTDVTLDVNGTVITNGFVYSTVNWKDPLNENFTIVSGGANIISSGKTGSFAMNNGAGQDMMGFMFDQGKSSYYIIPLASAQLRNGDGTYLDTTGAEAGATFNYCAPCDAWHASDYVHAAVEITWANLGFAADVTEEYNIGAAPEYKGATPTKATANCKAYTFAGWKDQDGKEYPIGTALPAATTDATYFAYFTESDAHSFTTKRGTEITVGTCMTEAVYAVKCDNCDAENTGKTVKGEKDPTNHTKKNTYVEGAKEATCGAEGYTGDTYCECGVVIETGETIPATGNHNYVTEVSRTAATCMAEGSVTNKCACGAEKTEVLPIDKTNHTKQNTTVKDAVEATCGAEGYTGDTYCECGEKIATGETIPATGNHNYVSEVSRTAATCMAEGSVTKKCGCGAQITETLEIDPTNHTKQNTTVKDAVEATCGAEGYTGDTYCECGEKIATGETIPATGNHNYVTEVSRTAATCMAEGSVTNKCACGAEKTEVLPIDKTNHTKQNTTVKDAVEATCGEDGYTGDTYCECGEKIATGKTIPATGAHVDGDDENHDCDNCPATGIEGHTPGAAVEEDRQEATCGAAGSYNTVVYCSECGEMLSSTANTIPATGAHVDGDDANHDCDVCFAPEVDGGCHGGEATCQGPAVCDECDSEYGDLDPENHASDAFTYENVNWDGTHVKSHECCGVEINGAEPCDYTTGEEEHTCACGQVEHFILTIEYIAINEDGELRWETKEVSVPYGARLIEVEEVAGLASEIYVNASNNKGVFVLDSYAFGPSGDELTGGCEIEKETMPGSDAWLSAEYIFTGWANYGEGWVYEIENEIQMTGWKAFDDGEGGEDWYYLDPETGIRAEGVARVPYPTEPINGFKYGPNAEDMANTDYNYPDATEAWFVFASGTENGENDGKFLNNYSGPANTDKTLISWAVKGMIPWHVGMVQLDENVYAYFIGDEVNGGNVMATGDVYVIRVADNCERAFAIGGIYTFGENGLLIDNHGIVDMGNGTKRYYQNAQLMAGAGLIEVPIDNNDNHAFIFVRGNGELVVNTKYWVGANSQNIVPGLYAFDENGYMINPAPADKNGVFAEDGALYFYENGKRTYKGLIEYGEGIIYVTTSGKLATGKYYVTKTDLIEGYEPGFYFFDAEGYMEITTRNGIVDGKFYVDGEVQYGAGLIEYNDGMIYVKSNGQVVMDQAYWITNTNNLLPAGCYEFDSEGYLQIDESLDGVVGLNYYIDGVKQFGNGLVKVEGGYIYVKTNGELATGTYWITRTNGLMSAGCYEFDTDGYMILG